MWLFTPFGFYSIVRKPGDAHLTVRARVADDLDRLREYCPELGPTLAHAGTDYEYRATVDAVAFGLALAAIGSEIDYPNFKEAVFVQTGIDRSVIYSKVWSILRLLPSRVPFLALINK